MLNFEVLCISNQLLDDTYINYSFNHFAEDYTDNFN